MVTLHVISWYGYEIHFALLCWYDAIMAYCVVELCCIQVAYSSLHGFHIYPSEPIPGRQNLDSSDGEKLEPRLALFA